MEHIYFLIAVAKVRQAERLQAVEMYRQVKELQRGDRGLRVNVLSTLSTALLALVGKVKAQKRTQEAVLDEECVGSKVNL